MALCSTYICHLQSQDGLNNSTPFVALSLVLTPLHLNYPDVSTARQHLHLKMETARRKFGLPRYDVEGRRGIELPLNQRGVYRPACNWQSLPRNLLHSHCGCCADTGRDAVFDRRCPPGFTGGCWLQMVVVPLRLQFALCRGTLANAARTGSVPN